MKKLYIFLSGFLCFSTIYAAEQSQELNAEIKADLSKLEADIKRAEEYHQKEQEYLKKADMNRAQEEDQTLEAAALFEKIKEQAEAEQKNTPVAESVEDIKEEINLEDILKDLGALNTTEEEILQEKALQNDIQEALKTSENSEVA